MAGELLSEFSDSSGATLGVDRDSGIIRGVKILGLESKNGRTYSKEAVARAVKLYEGAKVNVDHPDGNPSKPRSYAERIGMIENVHLDGGGAGLRGDLHANPKHPMFEQLAWDATNSPRSVGFSHVIEGKTKRQGGRTVVEEITRVVSVDLVADPATTRGLFENQDTNTEENDMSERTLTVASLREEYPGLITEILSEAKIEAASGEEAKQKDALIESQAVEIKTLKELFDKLTEEKLLVDKQKKITAAITEANLPEAAVSDLFKEQLMAAADDAAVKRLIEDRAGFAKSQSPKPKSREQNMSEGVVTSDSKELAASWAA